MACSVARLRPALHEREELVADVDEGGALRTASELEVEQSAVEVECAVDVVDLERDVVDADEPRPGRVVHGRIRWTSPNSCQR